MCLGACRECRYSGARSGIGGIRQHWGLPWSVGHQGAIKGASGVLRCEGCIGAGRECG